MSRPRPLWLAPRSVALLACACAALLALGASAQARRKDRTPPRFAGLKSAVTCIPGPIAQGRTSSYHLSWEAASDDVTPPGRIVYDIYQASAPGGEKFSRPTYRTAPGARSFSTPQLPVQASFYFVVRARDQARNEDKNRVERRGENLCL